MIRFTCPRCQAIIKAPDNKAGDKAPCPGCGQRLQVPAPPIPPPTKTVIGQGLTTSPAPGGTNPSGQLTWPQHNPPAPPPNTGSNPASPPVADRCWDCGVGIPEGEVRRRVVAVASSDFEARGQSVGIGTTQGPIGSGQVYNHFSFGEQRLSGSEVQTSKVSLCPQCDARRDQEELRRQQEEIEQEAIREQQAKEQEELLGHGCLLFAIIGGVVLVPVILILLWKFFGSSR